MNFDIGLLSSFGSETQSLIALKLVVLFSHCFLDLASLGRYPFLVSYPGTCVKLDLQPSKYSGMSSLIES